MICCISFVIHFLLFLELVVIDASLSPPPVCLPPIGEVESELLHTYSRLDPYDTLILCVRLAVLTAVTLTVPIVLFPVSITSYHKQCVWLNETVYV